jgi:hypothetical protein
MEAEEPALDKIERERSFLYGNSEEMVRLITRRKTRGTLKKVAFSPGY